MKSARESIGRIPKLEREFICLKKTIEESESGGSGFFPLPVIDNTISLLLNHNEVKTLTIPGDYFTIGTTVSIPGLVINSTIINSAHSIEIEVVGNTTDGFYDLIVTNESGSTTLSNAIQVEAIEWYDLRAGGYDLTIGNAAGNDIRHRSGLTPQRSATGLNFVSSNSWGSWAKMEFLKWNRGEEKTLQWIFVKESSQMMIGIGSDQTDENAGVQYPQAEIMAYFSSANSFWGFQGNNGTLGTSASQNSTASISSATYLKVKFRNDGKAGSTFTLYQLPSGNESDWNDESTILKNLTVANNMQADESVLMPFIALSSNGQQKFIAIKLQ